MSAHHYPKGPLSPDASRQAALVVAKLGVKKAREVLRVSPATLEEILDGGHFRAEARARIEARVKEVAA